MSHGKERPPSKDDEPVSVFHALFGASFEGFERIKRDRRTGVILRVDAACEIVTVQTFNRRFTSTIKGSKQDNIGRTKSAGKPFPMVCHQ